MRRGWQKYPRRHVFSTPGLSDLPAALATLQQQMNGRAHTVTTRLAALRAGSGTEASVVQALQSLASVLGQAQTAADGPAPAGATPAEWQGFKDTLRRKRYTYTSASAELGRISAGRQAAAGVTPAQATVTSPTTGKQATVTTRTSAGAAIPPEIQQAAAEHQTAGVFAGLQGLPSWALPVGAGLAVAAVAYFATKKR